jgi:hypothetical protein
MNWNRSFVLGTLLLAVALFSGYIERSEAAEGASSHYLPGAVGDILLAQPPAPGFQAANSLWFQSGNVGAAVLEGLVRLDVDLDLVLDLAAGTYTFEQEVLGGTYTVGALIPFGYADIEARLRGPFGGTFPIEDDSFHLSDIALIPIQLNWVYRNFSFKLSESVIMPTGDYDDDELANLGRNYWSFDTAGAVTWFDPEMGSEISIAPGIMFNTDTNYKTGTEFHVDATVNQFLSESFAIGLRGYYYDQLTGDSGSGAQLGDYKSESYGAGPGFIWIPSFAQGQLTVYGKWMHDFHAENRFDSDYVVFGGAWKF